MRNLVIATLDFVAYFVLVVVTLGGLAGGLATASDPYAPAFARTLAPIFGTLGGFLFGVLIAGGILVLTEIARNTRRTVELLERGPR